MRGPRRESEDSSPRLAAYGRLERASRRKLRNGRRRDLHLLSRPPRVDPRTRGAVLRGELPEPGEVHGLARLERIRDGIEKRVHGLLGITLVEAASGRHPIHEFLFGHEPLLLPLTRRPALDT